MGYEDDAIDESSIPDEFDDSVEDSDIMDDDKNIKDDLDEFELPEEAEDQTEERQGKLRKQVYPKTFGYRLHYAESEEGIDPNERTKTG